MEKTQRLSSASSVVNYAKACLEPYDELSPARFERTTCCLGGNRSILLSYED